MIFGGKGGEQALAESMKEKFKLVKKHVDMLYPASVTLL
jgi:hypothetical protein